MNEQMTTDGAADTPATSSMTTNGTTEAEELPLLAKMLNHLLTPGSSLTPVIWVSFNIIMFMLFCIWLMFVFSMPHSVHVWAFGALGLGLAFSTNWLMKLVFSEGLDFGTQQKQEEEKKHDDMASTEDKHANAKKSD